MNMKPMTMRTLIERLSLAVDLAAAPIAPKRPVIPAQMPRKRQIEQPDENGELAHHCGVEDPDHYAAPSHSACTH